MDGSIAVLAGQIVSMFLIMAVGFILVRSKLVDDHGVSQLSNVVMYVANPAAIVVSFIRPFDYTELANGLWSIAISLLVLVVTSVLAQIAFRKKNVVSQAAVIFSNSGFIGIPLVQSVLGIDYVFYLSMVLVAYNIYVWTYGVYLVSGDKKQASLTSALKNPVVISVCVGLVIYLTQLALPDMVVTAITDIANLNTGLAMLVLGAMLAGADIRSLLRDRKLYKASLLRLVVAPLVTIALLCAFGFLPVNVRLVTLIAYAAPTGVIVAMFADKFGKDYRYAAGVVSVSTLLSLLTMPPIMALALALF
ncbi:MAG: AEC family transporter [Tractidigestivibacter sp.]|uniref:AEC family transporter n=1 Tax=Tractidigestivibacter sp. TaxID=2847320 RepID=UPI003D8B179C